MLDQNMCIATFDPELWSTIVAETNRHEDHIELIASENYVSNCVLEAQGSVLTNKYAEGYPGKRYYGGCEFIAIIKKAIGIAVSFDNAIDPKLNYRRGLIGVGGIML